MAIRDCGTKKGLTKPEAEVLTNELMETLRQFSFSGRPFTDEEVAAETRFGFRILGKRLPTTTEHTPPFIREVLEPLTGPGADKKSLNAFLRKHGKELANPPSTAKGLRKWLTRHFQGAPEEEVIAFRDYPATVQGYL